MKDRKSNSTVTISAKVPKDISDYLDVIIKHSGLTKSEIIKNAIRQIPIQSVHENKTRNKLTEFFLLNQIIIKLEEISSHCKSNKAVDLSVLIQLKTIEDILLKKNIDDM